MPFETLNFKIVDYSGRMLQVGCLKAREVLKKTGLRPRLHGTGFMYVVTASISGSLRSDLLSPFFL